MSALRDAMSHAVLGWVKPELDETLRQARGEIEAFVENPSDSSRMRFCAGYLHQVQGTLRMVELYAPAMVAEEMELLAQALQQGAANDRDEACATLMRGTVLLPDYLERLQNGHRDIPIVLLPLLNDIRAARGAAGLNESVLFAPDLSAPLPAQLPAPSALPWAQRQDLVAAALRRFQEAMLAWPENGAPGDTAMLAEATAELLRNASHETTRRMLWVLSSVTAALRDGALAGNENLRGAFAAALRALQQASENEALPAASRGVSTQEPTRQLLYAVAYARTPHPALDELRRAFDLDAQMPSEAELDHARGSLAGRNRDLLNTVGGVVKEELLRVKDALDLHLRTGGDVAALQPQAADLTRVADTLGMLGLGVARDVVLQQRDALQAIAAGNAPASEGALLDIAGALLYVDATLDDQVASLGAGEEGAEDAAAAEARRTVEVLAHEALANFAAAREDFVAFIETNWDHARLESVPRLLEEVAGALRMLELGEPADYLEGVRRYILTELIGRRRVPSGRQLDTLADAMASLEYYLEALRDRRPNRAEILEIARSSLESLNYWPLPDAHAAEAPAAAAPASTPAAAVPPPLPAAPEPVAAAPQAPAAPAGLDWDSVELSPTPVAAPEPADIAGPVREVLEAPALEVELPPVVPQPPAIPSLGDAPRFVYDPVSGEYIAEAAAAAPDAGTAAVPPPLPADGPLPGAGEPFAVASAPVPEAPSLPAGGPPPLPADEEPVFVASASESAPAPTAPVPPPLPEAPAVVPPVAPAEPAAASHGQWLDLTVHIRPRVPAEPPAAEAAPPASAPAAPAAPPAPAAPAPASGEAAPAAGSVDPLLAEMAAAAAAIPPASVGAAPAVPPAPPVVVPAAPAPAATRNGGFDDNQDIDADIREVFLEEFEEERGNLARLLPLWLRAPDDLERLRPIRRVFHTLKGSGRLVGASALGEFAWKIESMLNRVLDGTRPASPAVVAMVQQATEVLPQFDAALRGTGALALDLHAIESVAERIAAGEEAFYSMPAPPAAVAAVVDEGTPASVDSVLREILETEVATHLETVDAWIAAARQAPQAVNDPLLRAMHTMNGAFAMTDVPEITAVTDAAETYIKRGIAAGHVPSAEEVQTLADTAATIRACIQALQAESPRIPSYAALAARLRAMADTLPEARWSQPEILEDEAAAVPAAPDPSMELTGVDLSGFLVDALGGDEAQPAAVDAGSAAPAAPQVPDWNLDAAGTAAPETSAPAVRQWEVEQPLAGADASAASDFAGEAMPAAPAGSEEAATDAGDFSFDWTPPEVAAEPAAPAAEPPAIAQATIDPPVAVEPAIEPAAADWNLEPVADSGAVEPAGIAPVAEESPAPAVDDASMAAAGPVAASPDPVLAPLHEAIEAALEAAAPEVPATATTAAPDEPAAEAPVQPEVAEAPAVAAEAPAAAPALPAETEGAPADAPMLDFSELDRDLVDIFVEEGGDLLDHIDALLVELRADSTAREAIIGLQRDLHTLKGGARMAGIATIGDLGHVIESLLEAAAEHRTELGRGDVQLLERGFDTLHQLLVQTRAHRATAMPHALIAAFEARIRGEAVPAVADDVPAAAPAAAAPAEAAQPHAEAAPAAAPQTQPQPQPQPQPVHVAAEVQLAATAAALPPLSAPVDEEAEAPAEEAIAPRAPQEQVRVRADLLDNLVNHAGEVAIYRARLEQQLGAFRAAMAELDRTNARLRDQLRRLDLETEAQIVARYQREQDSADPTFDPLELDRFSTLQQLSRALNESAADLTGLQGVLDDLARQYDVLLQQQSRVSSDLQDGLMSARMVPFDSVVPRLRRVVRQAGHDTGKQVQLRLDGTHGELDRNVLDRMVAPIEHMLRNSVAHGLETPAERVAAGKSEEGTITIALRHEGSEIVLQVSDDGRGLDRDAIRRRAEQRGLLKPGAVLTDTELDSLIFEAGFSTSEQVSQLAGRGVGMDVVRNEVRQLGGTVEIHSVVGRGVTFTLRLPQTLAVTQAVFVQIGETTYAVPVASVSGIGRISRERFESGTGGYRYAGEEYALHDLGLLVGQGPAKAEGQAQVPLLLVRAGDLRAAVAIDQVVGNREIVVKPVGMQIASVPGIYGATITGDGRVVVILDVAPLVRRHLAQPQRPAAEAEAQQQRHVPLVMVVDDSLTMRKVTGRVLERHNFEVVTARDGIEALEKLEERVPDLMLLDIEMPRMDGYELATAMRADARFRGVPIVMITSRTGEKHRQRAFEIGVQRYLGKPYQELDLMRNVYDLLGIARARD